MIPPVKSTVVFNFSQVKFGIWIKILISEPFKNFAFDGKAFNRKLNFLFQVRIKFAFTRTQISNSRQVDGHHTDGSGQRIGAEQTAAPLQEFPVVKSQPATHGAGIVG